MHITYRIGNSYTLMLSFGMVSFAGIWAALSGLAAPGTLIAASSAFCAFLFLLGLSDPRIRAVD